MDARRRDVVRLFQGQRFLAAHNGSRKKLAKLLGISTQAVDRHANGRAAAISYEHVERIAADPTSNPYAIVAGLLFVIEEVRARATGDVMELATRLQGLLHEEQVCDGDEDLRQQGVVSVLGAIPYMGDRLTLSFRRRAIQVIDNWIDSEMKQVDAALAAVGCACALRTRLNPVEGN